MTSPLYPNIDDKQPKSLDQLSRQDQAVTEGLKAADEGRLIDHETLTEMWRDELAAAID